LLDRATCCRATCFAGVNAALTSPANQSRAPSLSYTSCSAITVFSPVSPVCNNPTLGLYSWPWQLIACSIGVAILKFVGLHVQYDTLSVSAVLGLVNLTFDLLILKVVLIIVCTMSNLHSYLPISLFLGLLVLDLRANICQTDHVTSSPWPLILEIMTLVLDTSIRLRSLKFISLPIRQRIPLWSALVDLMALTLCNCLTNFGVSVTFFLTNGPTPVRRTTSPCDLDRHGICRWYGCPCSICVPSLNRLRQLPFARYDNISVLALIG